MVRGMMKRECIPHPWPSPHPWDKEGDCGMGRGWSCVETRNVSFEDEDESEDEDEVPGNDSWEDEGRCPSAYLTLIKIRITAGGGRRAREADSLPHGWIAQVKCADIRAQLTEERRRSLLQRA